MGPGLCGADICRSRWWEEARIRRKGKEKGKGKGKGVGGREGEREKEERREKKENYLREEEKGLSVMNSFFLKKKNEKEI